LLTRSQFPKYTIKSIESMRAFAVLLAVACCMSVEAARIKAHKARLSGKNQEEGEATPSALIEAEESSMNEEAIEAEESEMNEEAEDDTIETEEEETNEGGVDDTVMNSELKLNSLYAIVNNGAPLVPELVSSKAKIYKMKELMQLGNNYNVYDKTSGEEKDVKVLRVRGKWDSKYFGKGVSHAYDPKTGNKIFKIKRTRSTWNPVEWVGRFSYRILAPDEKNKKKYLYTINKDYFGRGFAWAKEEWRIYRGTKGDGELAYYCVGSYLGWDTKCYESVKDYNQGRKGLTVWGPSQIREMKKKEPVAELGQKWTNLATVVGLPFNALPDAYYVKVKPGADTALFIAFATILDTAHDINGKGNIVNVAAPVVNPVNGSTAIWPVAPGAAAFALPAKGVQKKAKMRKKMIKKMMS